MGQSRRSVLGWILLVGAGINEPTQAEPSGGSDIPAENQKQGALPAMDAAAEMSKVLLAAIETDKPAEALSAFFPQEPFERLKDIKRPEDYHRQLVKWFEADIHREHKRLAGKKSLEFESFKPGGCKWKAKGTELNKIPYWSCYRSRFFAKHGSERVSFEVRAMINWGTRWYVTHLGPIPK